jgi:hypothetical protein
MRQYYIVFQLMLVSVFSFSQTEKKTGKYRLILSPGISTQSQLFGELNLMYAGYYEGNRHTFPLMWGYRVGFESNFNTKHFVIAPKIGYEVAFLVNLRGNILGYIDDGNVDLRILPEIGWSTYLFNLSLGYGIPLLNFRTPDIYRLRFSLVFNLDKRLFISRD